MSRYYEGHIAWYWCAWAIVTGCGEALMLRACERSHGFTLHTCGWTQVPFSVGFVIATGLFVYQYRQLRREQVLEALRPHHERRY